MSIVGWLLGAAIVVVALALVYLIWISPNRGSNRSGHSPNSGQYRRVPTGKSPRVTTGQVNRVRTGQSPRVATGQTRQVTTGQMRSIRTGEVRAVSEFHAVSVVSDRDACQAARNLAGIRFLSAAAPPLPLANCGAPTCRCRYRHHEDRRYHERRDVSLHGADLKDNYEGPERRSGSDRRQTEWVPASL